MREVKRPLDASDTRDAMPRDRLGRPMEDLRISVIDRCNFRCSFCMPTGHEYSFLPRRELLSFEEITRLVRVFSGLGVEKVRLTGGEPLLRSEVEKLIAMISEVPGVSDLALTTNGFLLAEKASELKTAGLKRVTVSLQALDDEIFSRINGGTAKVGDVLRGIDAAAEVGLSPIKINVVVMKGVNEGEVPRLARFFKEKGHVVRFIEYMDVGTINGWDRAQVVPAREIVGRVASILPLREAPRRKASDVATRYRFLDDDSELGAIASVTEPFCGDCSRARLSADGKLLTCLFAGQGHDLKEPLRSGATDDEIEALISGVWARRQDRYSEERFEARTAGSRQSSDRRIEMFRIGG